jgi:hypothetical protein
MGEIPKVVFSTTLEPPLTWANTQVVAEDAVTALRRMKEEEEEDSAPIRTIGSISLNKTLLREGLVDILQLVVFPGVTGQTGIQPISQSGPIWTSSWSRRAPSTVVRSYSSTCRPCTDRPRSQVSHNARVSSAALCPRRAPRRSPCSNACSNGDARRRMTMRNRSEKPTYGATKRTGMEPRAGLTSEGSDGCSKQPNKQPTPRTSADAREPVGIRQLSTGPPTSGSVTTRNTTVHSSHVPGTRWVGMPGRSRPTPGFRISPWRSASRLRRADSS